jgi:hypothetical protein
MGQENIEECDMSKALIIIAAGCSFLILCGMPLHALVCAGIGVSLLCGLDALQAAENKRNRGAKNG